MDIDVGGTKYLPFASFKMIFWSYNLFKIGLIVFPLRLVNFSNSFGDTLSSSRLLSINNAFMAVRVIRIFDSFLRFMKLSVGMISLVFFTKPNIRL